jgi:hypothetical protein
MSLSLRAALAGLLVLVPAVIPAQPEAARWVSRWDRGECQLIRAVGDSERFGIVAVPNAQEVSLSVFPAADAPVPPGRLLRATINAPPATAVVTSERVTRRGGRADRSYEILLPVSVLDVLAGARAIRVDLNRVRAIDLPLRSSAAAIDVLRQCMRDQSSSAPQSH